jgi:hypothetical protein
MAKDSEAGHLKNPPIPIPIVINRYRRLWHSLCEIRRANEYPYPSKVRPRGVSPGPARYTLIHNWATPRIQLYRIVELGSIFYAGRSSVSGIRQTSTA